jgi:hypothetical protein
MRKSALTAAAAGLATVAVVAIPAQAHKPANHPQHPQQSHKCSPHKVGFRASGTLESATLTQTQGAGTTTHRDDRYSGTVTVTVKKATHHAATGSQTYTLDNDRVKFYDANHDGIADQPKAGDRVQVKGSVTRLGKKCDQSGFTPTTDVRRVEFRQPKKTK